MIERLAGQGILIRSPSQRGVAEEAPGAYKDAGAVARAAHDAGLARLVARLAADLHQGLTTSFRATAGGA